MNKKKAAPKSYEVNRKIRRDWNGISPVTKIIGDKRQAKRERIARKEAEDA